MSKIFASGLYKLSITLLVFSCLGFVFGLISLIQGSSDGSASQNAMSFVGSILQIAVCSLGIYGAKTYSFPALLIGAILCGLVVAFDLILAILWGIVVGAIIAVSATGGAGAGATAVVGLWLAIILLILPIIFFILYLIEFILLIRHAKRSRGGVPSETSYVKV